MSAELRSRNHVTRLDAAQMAQKAKKPIEYVAILERRTGSPTK
jgi:hypothetical protein